MFNLDKFTNELDDAIKADIQKIVEMVKNNKFDGRKLKVLTADVAKKYYDEYINRVSE